MALLAAAPVTARRQPWRFLPVCDVINPPARRRGQPDPAATCRQREPNSVAATGHEVTVARPVISERTATVSRL